MSSFAALLILISIHENSLKSTVFVSNPDRTVAKSGHTEVINEASSAPATSTVSKAQADFSYLKFDVANFATAGTGNEEMPGETDFTYLKFSIPANMETSSEIGALPEDPDFGYLKFDVNQYASDGEQELPSADFDYLKFDVQKYVQVNTENIISELPE
jgi:hypothetical protein